MLQRINARLRTPSPATVISMIALFVSLGGVGYAAATIGSAQIKNNSVASGDIRNRTITLKDMSGGAVASLRGRTGAQGLKGVPGQTGPDGAKGDQGVPGPITGVLPSGVSESGPFVARDPNNPAAQKPLETVISFPLRLSAGVPAFYVVSGGPAVPQCTGSAANPTAAPGNLCVYQSVQANTVQPSPNTPVTNPRFIDPATTQSTTTTTPFGVIFRVNSAGVGDAYVYGSWAVTAP